MKFPIFGASNDDMGTGTAYAALCSTFNLDWTATESARAIGVSGDASASELTFILATAPGVGNSRTFTLRKNGADTAATITISDTATTATWTGSVSYTDGDLIDIKATSTGTPTAPGDSYWWVFLNTTGQKSFVMGVQSSSPSTSATNYGNPFSGTTWTTLATAAREIVVSTGGNFTASRITTDVAPGASKSYAVSARVNNTTDALTATVSGSNTTANASGSQAVSAGDTLVIKSVPSGTPATVVMGWCLTFEPTTNGESIMGYGSASAMSTTATGYEQPLGSGAGWSNNESLHLMKVPGVSYKNLYVLLSAAPGAGTSRTFTMRDNGSSSALTTTISDAATTGNDTTHTITHTSGQTMVMQATLSGSVAAANSHFGYTIVTSQAAPVSTQMLMGV